MVWAILLWTEENPIDIARITNFQEIISSLARCVCFFFQLKIDDGDRDDNDDDDDEDDKDKIS